jgi:hypothetical protein
MATTPEGKVKAKVKALLNKYNAYQFMPATGGYGRSGVPDIVACVNGHFLAIECKAGNNKLTALQNRELDAIASQGGVVFIANEENFPLLETLVKSLTSSKGDK